MISVLFFLSPFSAKTGLIFDKRVFKRLSLKVINSVRHQLPTIVTTGKRCSRSLRPDWSPVLKMPPPAPHAVWLSRHRWPSSFLTNWRIDACSGTAVHLSAAGTSLPARLHRVRSGANRIAGESAVGAVANRLRVEVGSQSQFGWFVPSMTPKAPASAKSGSSTDQKVSKCIEVMLGVIE